MIKLICDRCGKEIRQDENFLRVSIWARRKVWDGSAAWNCDENGSIPEDPEEDCVSAEWVDWCETCWNEINGGPLTEAENLPETESGPEWAEGGTMFLQCTDVTDGDDAARKAAEKIVEMGKKAKAAGKRTRLNAGQLERIAWMHEEKGDSWDRIAEELGISEKHARTAYHNWRVRQKAKTEDVQQETEE